MMVYPRWSVLSFSTTVGTRRMSMSTHFAPAAIAFVTSDQEKHFDQTTLPVRIHTRPPLGGNRHRSVPDDGDGRQQGHPEVPASYVRTVVAAEERAEISAGTGNDTAAAQ